MHRDRRGLAAGTLTAARALPRWLLVAGLLVAAATFAVSLWVAAGAWFFGDDFVFLMRAQQERDWLHVFLPFGPRGWWSYRPLTIDVFFGAGFALFGMSATPLIVTSLCVHFATGILVFRIGVQLELENRIAFFCGVLSTLMYPSMHEIFWASSFQHVGAIFFYLLSVSLFLDHLDGRGRHFALMSLVAQLLTLMCNEFGVTLAGLLVWLALLRSSGSPRARALFALRNAWPQIALLAAYVVFRWVLLEPAMLKMPDFYMPRIGPHIATNLGDYASFLMHEEWWHAAATAALMALGWAATRRGEGSRQRLLGRWLLLLPWMIAVVVPFLGIRQSYHRMAMVLEAPFCLLLGAHLDALWTRYGTSNRRALEVAAVALLGLAVPFATLFDSAAHPRGRINREILALLAEHHPDPAPGSCVALVPRPGDVWSGDDLFELRFRTAGLLGAAMPGRRLELRQPDRRDPGGVWWAECAVLDLLPDFEVAWRSAPR